MLIVVGNSPSSGSTFLGDLLDSTPLTLCGGELGLFSSPRFFAELYRGPDCMATFAAWFQSPVSCAYLYYGYLRRDRLADYGLSYSDFFRLYRQHWCQGDRQGFVDALREAFVAYRRIKTRPVFCEKSPQNVACIREVLAGFDDAVFVHVVRNPAYIYPSLVKRGFSPVTAAATWLADVSAVIAQEGNPRVKVVHYEALVADPFGVVARLVSDITGEPVAPATVQALYEGNRYRQTISKKLGSWSVGAYGQVANANRKQLSAADASALAWLEGQRLAPGYVAAKGLAPVSMRDALAHYGYLDDYRAACAGAVPAAPRHTGRGRFGMVRKALVDRRYGGTLPFADYQRLFAGATA
ncbi:MAG: hypothetical protein K0S46_1491 [Moraxellaceae bacterium]|jgi:hypothetical protein|nr:hypothetical protein [Moraxellaceae bacterium]